MPVSSLHAPKYNSHAYTEKIPGAGIKEFFTGKKEPLNVLYIQGLDDDYTKTKKYSREHFDESIRSGEIKVKDLEGCAPEDKLKVLENTLLALRQQGRIDSATQIILSCKPGENAGELDISRDGIHGVWKVKEVIDAIRGGRTIGQLQSSSDFDGVIHIFGHSHEEFKSEERKEFGNVLIHASGKFNWSHQHAFMIGHIVKASRNIKDGTAEQITMQVRDAIQPYAGYPIYRIAHEKVMAIYPTFRNVDKNSVNRYINSIKSHKNPIDMLISSLERDSAKVFENRLKTGGLFQRIKEHKKDLAKYEILKVRLLGALISSKNDQESKLKLLADQLGIDFHGVNPKSWIGTSLQAEITRNLDRIDTGLLSLLNELKFEVVPDNNRHYLNFIKKKIGEGKLPELVEKFPSILLDRLKKLDNREVFELTYAAFESPNCTGVIRLLRSFGLKFRMLDDDQLQSLVKNFGDDPPQYTRLIDALSNNGADSIIEILKKNKKSYLTYNFLSSFTDNQEKIKDKLKQGIIDNDDGVKDLVEVSFFEATVFENLKPIKILMECGLSPNFDLGDGYTVLHDACKRFSDNPSAILNIVDLFSKAGADLKVRSAYAWSPLDLILHNMRRETVQVEEILRIFIEKDKGLFDRLDSDNLRLVHQASRLHNPVFLEALLKINPDYANNVSAPDLFTPLHVAIIQAREDIEAGKFKKAEFSKVVDILLRYNANLDVRDSNGPTPKEYMGALKGFEDFDLEKRKADLLAASGAVAV